MNGRRADDPTRARYLSPGVEVEVGPFWIVRCKETNRVAFRITRLVTRQMEPR